MNIFEPETETGDGESFTFVELFLRHHDSGLASAKKYSSLNVGVATAKTVKATAVGVSVATSGVAADNVIDVAPIINVCNVQSTALARKNLHRTHMVASRRVLTPVAAGDFYIMH